MKQIIFKNLSEFKYFSFDFNEYVINESVRNVFLIILSILRNAI